MRIPLKQEKVAFLDIDRVVAACDEREARALQLVDTAVQGLVEYLDPKQLQVGKNGVFYNKKAFYNQEWIAFDTVIDGAQAAIRRLHEEGYYIFFLTSRPDYLRDATCQWLLEHELLPLVEGDSLSAHVICKAAPFEDNFTKTTVLKAGLICTFVVLLQPLEEILVVDDEEGNLESIKTYLAGICTLRTYTSLAQVFAVGQVAEKG